MTELFVIQYVLVTIIAIILTERYPPHSAWSVCNKFTRVFACMIPIYREVVVLIVIWNKK